MKVKIKFNPLDRDIIKYNLGLMSGLPEMVEEEFDIPQDKKAIEFLVRDEKVKDWDFVQGMGNPAVEIIPSFPSSVNLQPVAFKDLIKQECAEQEDQSFQLKHRTRILSWPEEKQQIREVLERNFTEGMSEKDMVKFMYAVIDLRTQKPGLRFSANTVEKGILFLMQDYDCESETDKNLIKFLEMTYKFTDDAIGEFLEAIHSNWNDIQQNSTIVRFFEKITGSRISGIQQ